MSQIAIDAVVTQITSAAKQALGEFFQAQQQAQSTTVSVPAATITLAPGEAYAGPVLDENGNVERYLIKLPDIDDKFNRDDAFAEIERRGGQAPTDREAHVLVAQLRRLLPIWFWIKKPGSSDAWYCYSGGHQNLNDRSALGGAVAVRSVFPSAL